MSAAAFERDDFARVRILLDVAVCIEAIPRRSDDPLDKKLARRLANVMRGSWVRIDYGSAPDISSRVTRRELAMAAGLPAKRMASAMDWEEWLPSEIASVKDRIEAVRVIATRTRARWGRKNVSRLEAERDGLARILEYRTGRARVTRGRT